MDEEKPNSPPAEQTAHDTIVPQPATPSQGPAHGAGQPATPSQGPAHGAGHPPAPSPAGQQQAGGDDLERRWHAVQAGFVDDPKRAVQDADRLLDEVIQRLGQERAKLQGQWSNAQNLSTEDLRVALQRYRELFHSLTRR